MARNIRQGDNIAASMFVDGDTDGTAASYFCGTRYRNGGGIPRWRHFYVSLGTAIKCDLGGGNPDNSLMASADVVSDIQAEVFPNELSSASRIDTLQVAANGADGNG